MHYVQKPPRCEAKLLTPDNAADVAEWAGDGAMALPDGSVLYKVAGQYQPPCPVGNYLARDGASGILGHLPAETFELDWTPAED